MSIEEGVVVAFRLQGVVATAATAGLDLVGVNPVFPLVAAIATVATSGSPLF